MYKNFLQKFEENLKIGFKALDELAYNPAAVNAVHSAISAADAFCVYGIGKRCASENHKEAEKVVRKAGELLELVKTGLKEK